jgi:hypothetical protein
MSVDKAVQVLEQARQAEIERHRKEMGELDDAISRLRQQATTTFAEAAPEVAIRRGQWKDVHPKDALRQYLNDRGGGPIPFSQLVHDMRIAGGGGAEWAPDRYERNWKIMMSNNLKLFRYDESTDTVELVDAKKKRA